MSGDAIAGMLVGAHERATQVRTSGDLRDAAHAYVVQQLVWARIRPGQRVRAWKVGAPNAATEPTVAPILALHDSPADLSGGDFHGIGVEAEIAYRLARDLPRRESAYSLDEIAGAIGEAIVAIELCDTRLADWATASDLWKLADFQNNGCLVTGTGVARWREIDFVAQRAELHVNGEPRSDVIGAHPFGDPFRLLPRIVAHCARQTGGLRAGDLVTTGSWGGVHYVEPGCEVLARFAGIGEALVSIRGASA